MKMNNKKTLTIVLGIIFLIFIILLIMLMQKPSTKFEMQTTALTQARPVELVRQVLTPDRSNYIVGEIVSLSLKYENLTNPIQATDLILIYNPELLEFVNVTNLHPQFLNPRALNENGRLILSFVEQAQTVDLNSPDLTMAQLNFRAKLSGQATLETVLNQETSSSMVICGNRQDNQLTAAPAVIIKIN